MSDFRPFHPPHDEAYPVCFPRRLWTDFLALLVLLGALIAVWLWLEGWI